MTRRAHSLVLLLPLLAAAGSALAPSALAQAAKGPALLIEEGSVAGEQVVALGRDLVVAGHARKDVAALNGNVRISGMVDGEIIVLGGNVSLAPSARVGGDVFVLGGAVETSPGAVLRGRSVAYPTASSAWLALLEAPALGSSSGSTIILGAKLAVLTAWLALVVVFFATGGRQILATSETLAREPARCFTVGLTGILAMTLTALALSLLASALVGVPLLVLVVLFALVLKLWGMVAIFHALGGWVAARLLRRRFSPLNTATLGLLILGAIKLLPVVGIIVWYLATLVGVGAALVTKLGRREPWFELSPLPRSA